MLRVHGRGVWPRVCMSHVHVSPLSSSIHVPTRSETLCACATPSASAARGSPSAATRRGCRGSASARRGGGWRPRRPCPPLSWPTRRRTWPWLGNVWGATLLGNLQGRSPEIRPQSASIDLTQLRVGRAYSQTRPRRARPGIKRSGIPQRLAPRASIFARFRETARALWSTSQTSHLLPLRMTVRVSKQARPARRATAHRAPNAATSAGTSAHNARPGGPNAHARARRADI